MFSKRFISLLCVSTLCLSFSFLFVISRKSEDQGGYRVVLHDAQISHRVLGGNAEKSEAFAAAAEAMVVEDKPNVPGVEDGWFFLVSELRQIALGNFWEKPWEEVSRNKTDPIPSMLEFQGLLKEKGIDLIIVPVPAKGAIYPEKVAKGFSAGDAGGLTPMISVMKEKGLKVIDLEPLMLQWRTDFPDKKIYCAQDAHFSPFACQQVAAEISNVLSDDLKITGSSEMAVSEESSISIMGDQVLDSEWAGRTPKETLSFRYAGQKLDGKIFPVKEAVNSPVLLLGDSHTLVFSEGKAAGMHSEGAGVFDFLSAKVGYPLDRVGVRGSGLVQARKQLFYKAAENPGYWNNKKAVVWLFSSREFSQSIDRIIPIPLER